MKGADFVMTLDEVVQREQAAGVLLGPFHRDWLIRNRAPATVREHLRLGRERHWLQMARQGFASMDTNDANTAAFSARNTFTTEVCIIGDTINSAPPASMIQQFAAIPANDARAGKVYRLNIGGIYSNTATPTILFTPRWGDSTTIGTNVSLGAQPAAFTTITSTTNLSWFGQFDFAIWTAPPGATLGTGNGHGFMVLGVPSGTVYPALALGGTTATIDTSGQGTAHQGLQMGVTWGTSSASNSIQCKYYNVQSLN